MLDSAASDNSIRVIIIRINFIIQLLVECCLDEKPWNTEIRKQ
jgi:hypothetical protein